MTFRCGHERTPENSKPAGRWMSCKTCVLASSRASAKRRREREKAERPAAPHRPAKPVRDPTVASERRCAAVRKRISAKARERIALGLDPNTATQAAVRHAQYAIAAENELRDRLATPIEQAKAMLQRRYRPVVSEAIYGGDPEMFRVGHRTVTRDELLAMAGAA